MSDADAGRDTYQRMLQEHEQLRNLLVEVERVVAQRTVEIPHLAAKMTRLGRQLEGHFAMEEVSGCFAEMVNVAPRVSDRVNAFIGEHASFQAEMGSVIDLVNQCHGTSEDWDRIEARFTEFSRKLMDHEAAENELLQQVFTEDIGAKD